MSQQWREEANTAVQGLLRWAGILNVVLGIMASWSLMSLGANFFVSMLFIIPSVIGIWQLSQGKQLSDRWLVNGAVFYVQAIISVLFGTWIAGILLWLGGRRLQIIASQYNGEK